MLQNINMSMKTYVSITIFSIFSREKSDFLLKNQNSCNTAQLLGLKNENLNQNSSGTAKYKKFERKPKNFFGEKFDKLRQSVQKSHRK